MQYIKQWTCSQTLDSIFIQTRMVGSLELVKVFLVGRAIGAV
jgi:hypothetical protein